MHKVYALLQNTIQKDLSGCNEVPSYENAMGKDRAVDFMCMDYITANVDISLFSLSAQDNAD